VRSTHADQDWRQFDLIGIAVGRVLEALARLGLDRSTVVALTRITAIRWAITSCC